MIVAAILQIVVLGFLLSPHREAWIEWPLLLLSLGLVVSLYFPKTRCRSLWKVTLFFTALLLLLFLLRSSLAVFAAHFAQG